MTTCEVENCEKPVRCKNLCQLHYDRMRRYGRLDNIKAKAGSGYTRNNGYRARYNPTHVLSKNCNWVYEHRLVLFEEIGYGPHQCSICGTLINWGYDLQVDHIDFDRQNNALENLRPTCGPCNRQRRNFLTTQTECVDCGKEIVGTAQRKFCNGTCRQRTFQRRLREAA